MPRGLSSCSHSRRAGLYTESVTRTWSPDLAAAKKAVVIADMPVGEKATPSPPSPARRISSRASVVGVPRRPYTDIVRSPACIASSVSRRSATLSKRMVEARRISGAGVRKRPRFMVTSGRIARRPRAGVALLQDGEGVDVDPAVAAHDHDLDLVGVDRRERPRPDEAPVCGRLPKIDPRDLDAVNLDPDDATSARQRRDERHSAARERVRRRALAHARVADGAARVRRLAPL